MTKWRFLFLGWSSENCSLLFWRFLRDRFVWQLFKVFMTNTKNHQRNQMASFKILEDLPRPMAYHISKKWNEFRVRNLCLTSIYQQCVQTHLKRHIFLLPLPMLDFLFNPPKFEATFTNHLHTLFCKFFNYCSPCDCLALFLVSCIRFQRTETFTTTISLSFEQ